MEEVAGMVGSPCQVPCHIHVRFSENMTSVDIGERW